MPIMRVPVKGVAISEALADAYASAPDDIILLETLELRHAMFVEAGVPFAIRVVNNNEDINAYLEDDAVLNPSEEVLFRKCGFSLRRPKESGSGEAAELQIHINNVALYLMPYLLAAKGTRQPVYVTWRPYAANDLTGPHMLPTLTATMKNVKCGIASVSGVASFSDSTNLRFPTLEYTGRLHPALTAR